MRPLLLTLFLAASFGSVAGADVLTIEPAKDNTLYQSSTGGLSNGAGIHMFAGLTATSERRRAVLEFDLSAIPPGSTVVSATLELHMSKTLAGPVDVHVHRVLAEWGEAGSDAPGEEGGGAAAQNGDATWIHTFFPGSTWSLGGGDYDPTPSATVSVGGIGNYSFSSAGMAADVQAWVDDATSNHGWLLRTDENAATTTKRFDTRENPTVGLRPRLVVDYTPPSPGTAYCFGLGCPCSNDDITAGCANSTGSGATLATGGSTSASADDITFAGANLLPNQPALLFVGNNAVGGGLGVPFGDGLRCAGGGVVRLGVRIPDGQGNASWGPGLRATGGWNAGDVRRFQGWYRDPQGSPCSSGFNLTHGVEVTFVP